MRFHFPFSQNSCKFLSQSTVALNLKDSLTKNLQLVLNFKKWVQCLHEFSFIAALLFHIFLDSCVGNKF